MPAPWFYAVAKGRTVGVFNSWAECEKQVKGFNGAKYKKFSTLAEAGAFAFGNGQQVNPPSTLPPTSSSKATAKRPLDYDDVPDDSGPSKAAKQDEEANKKFRGAGFVLDGDGTVQVFTDGACHNNGKAIHTVRAGIGVFWNHHHPKNVSAPLPDGMRRTNNVAEIQAVIEAIKIAKAEGFRSLCVNTDSQFLINCITNWIESWKRKGWKTSKGEPVINKEELLVLDGLIREDPGFKVKWNHVRGHVGVEGNEEADRLANAGATQDRRT